MLAKLALLRQRNANEKTRRIRSNFLSVRRVSFLPIIERELRAAARRKGTFRVRWWTTLIATFVTLVSLRFVSTRPLPAGVTNPLFAVLAGCAFILCLLAGVFLTSDSLSEEKREGTLGLLFLSNLLGGDIVLGKFSALALNAFFSVLALLPVMGVPLLLGGVGFAEFSRMVLALINILFFSLALGICVSAYGRAQSTVVASTLALLLLVVAGLPALAELAPTAALASPRACVAWSSPLYPFAYAFEATYARQPLKFWGTLIASNLLGWIFLGLASHVLPQRWQDSGKVADSPIPGSRSIHPRWAGKTMRSRHHGQFSPDDAVGWLLGQAPVATWIIWVCLGAWGLVVLGNWGSVNEATLVYGGTKLLAFVLKMLLAFQACRFFSESRSSGALELLLCTPLGNSEIIRAQWRKLRRIFLWPSIVLILLALVSFALVGRASLSARGPWNAWIGEPGFGKVCWIALSLGADALAVGWCGMWLSLSLRKPILAPALTIILVLILPSLLS